MTNDKILKKEIYEFWNARPCNADLSKKEKHTREYYDEIEKMRYSLEPYIWNFAHFAMYRGKKVLEIGVGMGTDFIQWVRSGSIATGCDLTPAAIEHTKKRLEIYNLSAIVQEEDSENLSFPDETFDLVYSFGVIHHTADPVRAISEIYRVLKKGGTAKVMLYHRYSWPVFRLWVRHGLKKGNPFRSIDDIFYKGNIESPGTKVYSIRQVRKLFQKFSEINISPQLTPYDFCDAPTMINRKFTSLIVRALSSRIFWNILITAVK